MAGKKIHKGNHHDNDCEHYEDEYLLSCTTKTKSGLNIKWDCYMFDNSCDGKPAEHSLCLRMGDSGGDYISIDLKDMIKRYLCDRTNRWE
ncbi:MAG TPA: hypothetical protein DCM40_08545 [Maribacter sp.]|nr:hypothetical protein [Maribacter sp.]